MSLTKSELDVEAEAEQNLQTASKTLAGLYEKLENTINDEWIKLVNHSQNVKTDDSYCIFKTNKSFS